MTDTTAAEKTPVKKKRGPKLDPDVDFKKLPDAALIRQRALVQVIPFSSPTLWRRCRQGLFPKPVRLPGRITAWRWGEVRVWLEAQR